MCVGNTHPAAMIVPLRIGGAHAICQGTASRNSKGRATTCPHSTEYLRRPPAPGRSRHRLVDWLCPLFARPTGQARPSKTSLSGLLTFWLVLRQRWRVHRCRTKCLVRSATQFGDGLGVRQPAASQLFLATSAQTRYRRTPFGVAPIHQHVTQITSREIRSAYTRERCGRR